MIHINTYHISIKCMNVKPSGMLHRISVASLLLEYVPHPMAGRRFLRNEALRICHQGSEIARGIINFSSEELWEAQCKWKVCEGQKYGWNFQYDSSIFQRRAAKRVKHRVSTFQHLLCCDFKHLLFKFTMTHGEYHHGWLLELPNWVCLGSEFPNHKDRNGHPRLTPNEGTNKRVGWLI